jgi:hypothetical protein
MSSYKSVLNTAPVKNVSSDNTYTSLDDALKFYESLNAKSSISENVCDDIAENICDEAYNKLNEIHNNLKTYWEAFGFLDKSSARGFRKWAAAHMVFAERAISLLDESDSK